MFHPQPSAILAKSIATNATNATVSWLRRELATGIVSSGQTPDPQLDRPDRVDAIMAFLSPVIDDVLRRIEGDEFTTPEFIELLQTDEGAKAAYEEALRRWGEGERYAKMVVHGQVIPGILRRSELVEWLGFAHGIDDPFAVPARWRLTADAQDPAHGVQGTP